MATLLLLVAMHCPHASEIHVLGTQPLQGDTKWDYLSVEPDVHQLFITHGDRVEVFDTRQDKVIGVVPDTHGVHGVALAPEIDRGYTSNGASNTVSIFEISTLKILGELPAEKKPDAIIYDTVSRRVFAANGDSGSLTVVDTNANRVIETIFIGGKLEFMAVDGRGRLYVNVEDRNALVVLDTQKLQILAQYDISSTCNAPTGLSIDKKRNRLFIGCRNSTMTILSSETGQVLASLPVGKGCDATAYDPELNQAFASSGDGKITVINADSLSVEQVILTKATARTMALDPYTHRLYTVAAEIETPASDGVRATLKPGTFQLLILGR